MCVYVSDCSSYMRIADGIFAVVVGCGVMFFADVTPAEHNRSGRNLTVKRRLGWDARLENFGALRWREKNEKIFVRTNNVPFGALPVGRFP